MSTSPPGDTAINPDRRGRGRSSDLVSGTPGLHRVAAGHSRWITALYAVGSEVTQRPQPAFLGPSRTAR